MYDIRQFRPALYTLLFLGLSGFALAAESPGLWVLSASGLLLNAWLIKTNRFRPMPRLLASIVTILAFLYTADQVVHALQQTPIMVIGQFLVLLQLVKLYEQRGNRDYAQLLVLSLLLMVAGSINTASLIFGIMLIAYLFLSLYCCLLFHLKVESEQARKVITVPPGDPNPVTLRQDQRYLSRSMRRLTGLVSIASVSMAIVVFLFFPRGTGANLLGQMQYHTNRAMTGFSEQVSFQQVARITQSNEVVARVFVWKNNEPMRGTQPLLLRGLTLNRYNGNSRFGRSRWQWVRSPTTDENFDLSDNETKRLDAEWTGAGDVWRQEIHLEPTGTNVLFAMAGPGTIRPQRRASVKFSRGDETLQTQEQLAQPITYEVLSRGWVKYTDVPPATQPSFWGISEGWSGRYSRRFETFIDPKVTEYALKPEVSGSNANGPLADQRGKATVSPLDDEIATAIERHLHSSQFSYTLDLTDAQRIEGEDPMVSFLYTLKRGHCEYFAGAMTLMCQSLGLQARMVIGFKCDEYNDMPGAGFYIVRQSHAHAWVEVRMPDGTWKTFDPTSGHDSPFAQNNGGILNRLKHFFDFMEYTWASNVIAYDRGSRNNLVQAVDRQLTSTAVNSSQTMSDFLGWLRGPQQWLVKSRIFSVLIGMMVFALFVAVGWFLFERWQLRRRAARIGLNSLPATDQIRLVRQLGFYDDLLRMLERRGITRPRHLTPLEFSESLTFLPNEAYDAIRRMTGVFYRIRFGAAHLSAGQQHRLTRILGRLESCLPVTTP